MRVQLDGPVRAREAILPAVPGAAAPLDALADVDRTAGLAYLTGLAAGYAQRVGEVAVETVWSGPGSPHVPVRATAAVLADVVREARRELLLMTYSARRFQPLTAALQAAVDRGVQVRVVVETLRGAGSALGGGRALSGVRRRGRHRIVALAHGEANRGGREDACQARGGRPSRPLRHKREPHPVGCGKEHRGGPAYPGGAAPARAAEHVDALRASGDLIRLN